MKSPNDMTASELKRAIESCFKRGCEFTDKLIDAGFGYTLHSDLVAMAQRDDATPLLKEWWSHETQRRALRDEEDKRKRYHGTLDKIKHVTL